jgi:hypothetical protein
VVAPCVAGTAWTMRRIPPLSHRYAAFVPHREVQALVLINSSYHLFVDQYGLSVYIRRIDQLKVSSRT